MVDYFISHSSADGDYAEWVDQVLRAEGFSTVTDVYDFSTGENFILAMNDALRRAESVLLLWSVNAAGRFAVELEWSNTLANNIGRLIPVILDATPKPHILAGTIHVDLSTVEATTDARRALLQGLLGKPRPTTPLLFPRDLRSETGGTVDPVISPQPTGAPRRRADVDAIFAPRSRQTRFADVIAGASSVWLAAKGFESLLHHHEHELRGQLTAGTTMRFLMNDPSDLEAMRIMASMSNGNRDPAMVAARLRAALGHLLKLRQAFPHNVSVRVASWLVPNGYTFCDPEEEDGRVYVEFFDYRLSLGERMSMHVNQVEHPATYRFYLQSYQRQWHHANEVCNE